jgi:hypothetical protein
MTEGDDDSPYTRDIADRVLRRALAHPENLRALLQEVLKELAGKFDFSRARAAPRDFLLEDWRGREADRIFEIPYRENDDDQTTLVCVLIEHQTRPDARMPLRTLIYAGFIGSENGGTGRWRQLRVVRFDSRLSCRLCFTCRRGPGLAPYRSRTSWDGQKDFSFLPPAGNRYSGSWRIIVPLSF